MHHIRNVIKVYLISIITAEIIKLNMFAIQTNEIHSVNYQNDFISQAT